MTDARQPKFDVCGKFVGWEKAKVVRTYSFDGPDDHLSALCREHEANPSDNRASKGDE